jgi:hypothetical protein
MRKGWLALACVVLVSLSVGHWGCEVPPLMGPESSVTLYANPEFIVANGGVSVITAIVAEPAGTFVPDGTVVFFFTDLGRVDPEGKTVNGVARVNLVADSRSGPANVLAYSGGDAPVPAASAASGTGSSVTVNIGSALPQSLIVTADPPRLRGPSSATIIANVFDVRGNPVANVPVIFDISSVTVVAPPSPAPPPAPQQETLDSGGRQRFTDTNGQVFDTLRTRAVAGGDSKLATVRATAANGKSGDVAVPIN